MAFYVEKHDLAAVDRLEETFQQLLEQNVASAAELEAWMKRQSRLFEEVQESLNGHYVDFQCRNDDEVAKQRFAHDQQVVLPLVKKYEALFDRKFAESPYREQLDQAFYAEYIKSKQNALELFREENIPLEVKEDELQTAYFEATGSLTVWWQGEEKTLQQMHNYLQEPDRAVRENAWRLVQDACLAVKEQLQQIMNQLLQIRQQKARNADLPNYRDYMFKKYERFSYTPADCHRLAEAVHRYVVPLKEAIEKRHQAELGVDRYRPWDTEAAGQGREPLRPFATEEELVEKTKRVLAQVDPRIGELLERMNRSGMLDLASRKAKSPGGFCIALPVSGLSFIFMNASGKQDDVVTLIHEMGHCFHNELKRTLPVREYKETPMESSELASTSLEFLTLDKWGEFYPDRQLLKRAQREHLEAVVKFLPWGVVIDQFQHWMYEHPAHTAAERNAKFLELARTFLVTHQDWSGFTEELAHLWQRQLHIFEVPFYYIEYVIANLGALQMYRQYKQDPQQAVANYKKALSLGRSRPLPEVYEAAGIRFDFSAAMIRDLMAFVQDELAELAADDNR
ncbi:M3 family oligoendopeptidase [Brevibacillus marinus]|uniref:M3 family oligoendopeptidase n=1 Tax=Brevibacillus marinus TaxID=2496837 RepID=UPI000F817FAF|nr:M3 family oligoendopeptidase [Brevibacillus marinus]